jgi:hypothetical protein
MDHQTTKAIQRNAWTLLKADSDNHGRRVELRSLTSGKGGAKITMWRMYCDGEYVGYAATAGDAEENYARVLNGLRRDTETGQWVPNPPMSTAEENKLS